MEHWIDDSDQLKPCPFCGGEAEIGRIDGDENTPNFGGMFVQCLNPLCEASSALIFPCGEDPKPLLMERWNKRPLESPPAPKEVAGALEEWAAQYERWSDGRGNYPATDAVVRAMRDAGMA